MRDLDTTRGRPRDPAYTRARNSLGQPWAGETWRCSACGESGPDRDDLPLSGCAAHPARVSWAPHEIVFSPAEHDAAISARRTS